MIGKNEFINVDPLETVTEFRRNEGQPYGAVLCLFQVRNPIFFQTGDESWTIIHLFGFIFINQEFQTTVI